MEITIDNKEFSFNLNDISLPLLNATEDERRKFEISPSGYGIHWHLIEEDLSVDGLLKIPHEFPKRKSA